MIDLTDMEVIDGHVHAFLPSKESEYFERYLTLSMSQIPASDMEHTFAYRRVVRELARIMNCQGDPREVIKIRHQRYKDNPKEYIQLLFREAKIEAMLVDMGYPSEEWTGYTIPLSQFQDLVGDRKLRPIHRIDRTIMLSIAKARSFDGATQAFHKEIEDTVRSGSVALKTAVAYTTGLGVKKVAETKARRSFQSLASRVRSGRRPEDLFFSLRTSDAKAVMDYFIFLAAKKCSELKIPLQLHTGAGDAPQLDLRLANPTLLYDLIGDKELRDCKFILIHCGYPFVEEVGFLVNTYSNVYADLSEMVAFIGTGIKDKLLRLFEMAPLSKIIYGSDGYNIPELFWISAIETKKALSAALNEMIISEEIDESWAMQIGRQIFSENAKRIYQL